MDAKKSIQVKTHSTANAVARAMRLTEKLNKLSYENVAEIRTIFSELTGQNNVGASNVNLLVAFMTCNHQQPRIHISSNGIYWKYEIVWRNLAWEMSSRLHMCALKIMHT